MTVHIRKTIFFIISISKFKRYLYKNCHFHIVSCRIDIESYLITFLPQATLNKKGLFLTSRYSMGPL
jgi:hypothetical protein